MLDAVGEPVVRALGVTGKSQTFQLAPKTYAVRATTTTPRALLGSLKAPIELYRDRTEPIGLRPRSTPPGAPVVTEPLGPADIALAGREQPRHHRDQLPDPLAVAEIMDEAGHVVAVTPASEDLQAKPGFYHVRHIGLRAPGTLRSSSWPPVSASRSPATSTAGPVRPRARHGAGRARRGRVRAPDRGRGPRDMVLPSTIVATGVAAALQGRPPAGLGIDDAPGPWRGWVGRGRPGGRSGSGRRGGQAAERGYLAGRRAGQTGHVALAPSSVVAGVVVPVDEPKPYWVSFRAAGAAPTVVPVAVLQAGWPRSSRNSTATVCTCTSTTPSSAPARPRT